VRVAPVLVALGLMVAAPAVASADVIFDPADADELAATLAEATDEQDVCYGWTVKVDDAVAGASQSVGSNFGAGKPVSSGSCRAQVEFNAYITYTSESSESEDSASYDVVSSPGGPNRDDLDALDLDLDSLTGEDPDVVVGKAVAALPLLAADKGMAKAIEAAPETADAPADAALTDDPGSDWWRENGGVFVWGIGLLLAGGVFAWWVIRNNKVRWTPSSRGPAPVEQVPDYVPADFYEQRQDVVEPEAEPAAEPTATPDPEATPDTTADPATEGTEAASPAEESTSDEDAAPSKSDTAPSEPAAPSDQKDKE